MEHIGPQVVRIDLEAAEVHGVNFWGNRWDEGHADDAQAGCGEGAQAGLVHAVVDGCGLCWWTWSLTIQMNEAGSAADGATGPGW